MVSQWIGRRFKNRWKWEEDERRNEKKNKQNTHDAMRTKRNRDWVDETKNKIDEKEPLGRPPLGVEGAGRGSGRGGRNESEK